MTLSIETQVLQKSKIYLSIFFLDFLFLLDVSLILWLALFEDDFDALFYISKELFEMKDFKNSFRYLKRALKKSKERDALYMMKTFYENSLGDVDKCPIKIKSLEKEIEKEK